MKGAKNDSYIGYLAYKNEACLDFDFAFIFAYCFLFSVKIVFLTKIE